MLTVRPAVGLTAAWSADAAEDCTVDTVEEEHVPVSDNGEDRDEVGREEISFAPMMSAGSAKGWSIINVGAERLLFDRVDCVLSSMSTDMVALGPNRVPPFPWYLLRQLRCCCSTAVQGQMDEEMSAI